MARFLNEGCSLSNDTRKARRKMEIKLARMQRFESAGAGKWRKTLNAWTWSNRLDMAVMLLARNVGRTKTQQREDLPE